MTSRDFFDAVGQWEVLPLAELDVPAYWSDGRVCSILGCSNDWQSKPRGRHGSRARLGCWLDTHPTCFLCQSIRAPTEF